jgi:hypothetical protein
LARLRATIATVVMLSALARLVVFGVAGLFLQPGLVALAVLFFVTTIVRLGGSVAMRSM